MTWCFGDSLVYVICLCIFLSCYLCASQANLKARGLPVDPRQWTDANQADKLTLLSETTTVVRIR